MKRAAVTSAVFLIASAAGLFVSAIAQTSSQHKDVIPPRSIHLTAEQSHVIKEIVLSDMRAKQAPRNNAKIQIGDKVPDKIKLQNFPPLVNEKVPQVRTYKFFVTQSQVVIVSPQDNVVADIIK